MTTATAQLATAPAADAIRPFRVNVPETALADLRRRPRQARESAWIVGLLRAAFGIRAEPARARQRGRSC